MKKKGDSWTPGVRPGLRPHFTRWACVAHPLGMCACGSHPLGMWYSPTGHVVPTHWARGSHPLGMCFSPTGHVVLTHWARGSHQLGMWFSPTHKTHLQRASICTALGHGTDPHPTFPCQDVSSRPWCLSHWTSTVGWGSVPYFTRLLHFSSNFGGNGCLL